jgi:hypothetical protein
MVVCKRNEERRGPSPIINGRFHPRTGLRSEHATCRILLQSHANSVVTGLFWLAPTPSHSGQSGAHAPCILAAHNQSVVITGRTWQSSPLLVPLKYGEDDREQDESARPLLTLSSIPGHSRPATVARPQSPTLCLARCACASDFGYPAGDGGPRSCCASFASSLSFPHDSPALIRLLCSTKMMLSIGKQCWRGSPAGVHVTAAASQWTVLG